MTWNIAGNVKILNNTNQYCPNNAQYCPILSNIANICTYCPILSCFVQYCSTDYFRSFLSELWHSDIVQYCQIYPNIVRHWLILSSIDQYCPVTPCLDIFQLKQDLNHFKPDLDAVKYWLYASMQLYKYTGMHVCNYACMHKAAIL